MAKLLPSPGNLKFALLKFRWLTNVERSLMPMMWMRMLMVLLMVAGRMGVEAAGVTLPVRPAGAMGGAEFARQIEGMPLAERERTIREEIARGNVPAFWRQFAPVKVTPSSEGRTNAIEYFVAPDYLAVGADEDYFIAPVTPQTAQAIADELGCVLPTRKMVDDIYAAAAVKLVPKPIPPSSAMTSVPVFAQHNETVRQQRRAELEKHPLGALTAGHKKDLVITPRLASSPGKVAIYGWHQPGGKAIQPLYLGHADTWVDYSQGTRLVLRTLTVNGKAATVDSVLADPQLAGLLGDEGPLVNPRYGAVKAVPNEVAQASVPAAKSGKEWPTLRFDPGVRVVMDEGAGLKPGLPVQLVLFALPNGNTIEQTMGRKLKPGDDWHFDIQHIAAQTRWLRERMTNVNLVVAYLECAEKAWPAWRRAHDTNHTRIPPIVDALRQRYAGKPLKLVLTGHSGGGSFTFGYLNGIQRIPDDIERIAFLDSNYAYDTAQHAAKLTAWLRGGADRYLCVLAYQDSVALLNGKTFVSESGGTWGRSHLMQKDLAEQFEFTSELDTEWERYTALNGRLKFLLKTNPTKAVFHTRQVEWNGFIHAMLMGSSQEGNGYQYFGARAYEPLILEE